MMNVTVRAMSRGLGLIAAGIEAPCKTFRILAQAAGSQFSASYTATSAPVRSMRSRRACRCSRACPTGEVEILGILSLFFWSLVLVVTVKYVMLVMRADNHGEGGILALMALAQRVAVNTSMRNTLAMVGIVGACLFFGDGIITPAISVLSAVEGLEVAAPTLQEYVLPISIGVIIALFAMQYRGTHSVGRVFGPVMAVWFVVLALLGHWSDRPPSGCVAGDLALARDQAVPGLQIPGVRRARRGRAVRDRGRSAVCRHGSFWSRYQSGKAGCSSCCPVWCCAILVRARCCCGTRRRWKTRSS